MGDPVRKMRRILLIVFSFSLAMLFIGIGAGEGGHVFSTAPSAYAQNNWKKDFNELCSKTQDAMGFTEGELKELIDRCDRLKPVIDKLDETERKVYRKRLKMCRDLFNFVLESKTKAGPPHKH